MGQYFSKFDKISLNISQNLKCRKIRKNNDDEQKLAQKRSKFCADHFSIFSKEKKL